MTIAQPTQDLWDEPETAHNAAVIGASMLAIHHALSPENIDAMAG